MINKSVTKRVFYIRIETKEGYKRGTAFVLDHKNKQYLITNKHLLEGRKPGTPIQINQEKGWRNIETKEVGIGRDDTDIAVLAAVDGIIAPDLRLKLEACIDDINLGEPVYFLGFPFGLHSGSEEINQGCPIPFIGYGTIAAFGLEGKQKTSTLYINGHGNHGLSGGPVVYAKRPISNPVKYYIAGIISIARRKEIPVFKSTKGGKGEGESIKTSYFVRENSGIIEAVGIQHAIDIIEANPIGFPISSQRNQGELHRILDWLRLLLLKLAKIVVAKLS